jgi:hypothetical protein
MAALKRVGARGGRGAGQVLEDCNEKGNRPGNETRDKNKIIVLKRTELKQIHKKTYASTGW